MGRFENEERRGQLYRGGDGRSSNKCVQTCVFNLFSYFLCLTSRIGGAAGIPAGAITAGVTCSLAQVIVNEANIQRVKYASSLGNDQYPASFPVSEAKPKKSLLDHALRLVGVTRASDDEYLQKLKWQRERLLKRIEELEKEDSEAFTSDGALEGKTNDSA